MKKYFFTLFFCRIKMIWHCIKTFHTDVKYTASGKIIKIKCKECNKTFYENFKSYEDKIYFETEIEKEIDKENG